MDLSNSHDDIVLDKYDKSINRVILFRPNPKPMMIAVDEHSTLYDYSRKVIKFDNNATE